jgi:hypothetical protein
VRNWPALPETPIPESRTQRRRGGNAMGTSVGVVLALLTLSLFSGTHLIFALIAIPVVIAMAWSNPVAAIGILPVWMVAMGLVRRITPGGGNSTFSGDPVLIIGPLALLVLWMLVASSREGGRMSPLARWIMFFDIVAVLEAFNPSQGSLLTGVGGLLFLFIPTTAFWIGRRFADEELIIRVIWTVAILGLISAVYGLYQQFVGFPSWDASYVSSKAYTALQVGNGVTRAFGTFSSGQEYAVFLSVAVVAWLALLGRRTRWPILLHLAALGTIMVALWYESQRTSVFLTVLAIGVIGAARLRLRPINVMGAGVVAVILLIVLAGAIGGGGGGSSALNGPGGAGATLNQHQISGITNPTGKNSSLNGHIKTTRIGIKSAFLHPLGHGVGSVTLAASRFTKNNKSHGTEFDPGNMGVALGLPGFIIYLVILFFALQTAYRLAVRRRDAVGLFVIGILAATLFQWFNGDLYSVCWLIWLSLGFADRLLQSAAPVQGALDDTPVASPAQGFTWRRPGEPRRGSGL